MPNKKNKTTLPWAMIGAGAWGTALADTLAHAGNPVMVWDRDPLVVDDLNRHHRNRKRYPEPTNTSYWRLKGLESVMASF